MAKLSPEITAIVNDLKQRALDIVDEATKLELMLFALFGETEETISYLEEMKSVGDEAAAAFSRLSTLQLQIAKAQPIATSDMLEMLTQAVNLTQIRIPVLDRSIQEVKLEWSIQ